MLVRAVKVSRAREAEPSAIMSPPRDINDIGSGSDRRLAENRSLPHPALAPMFK
jgi:hypothetical protein